MSRRFLSFKLLLMPALLFAACTRQQQQPTQQHTTQPAAPAATQATNNAPPAAPKTHLKVGDPAPAFTLTNTKGEKVSLADFKGKKNVVLAFYVLAFTSG